MGHLLSLSFPYLSPILPLHSIFYPEVYMCLARAHDASATVDAGCTTGESWGYFFPFKYTVGCFTQEWLH